MTNREIHLLLQEIQQLARRANTEEFIHEFGGNERDYEIGFDDGVSWAIKAITVRFKVMNKVNNEGWENFK